jgi:hypothetical protein
MISVRTADRPSLDRRGPDGVAAGRKQRGTGEVGLRVPHHMQAHPALDRAVRALVLGEIRHPRDAGADAADRLEPGNVDFRRGSKVDDVCCKFHDTPSNAHARSVHHHGGSATRPLSSASSPSSTAPLIGGLTVFATLMGRASFIFGN